VDCRLILSIHRGGRRVMVGWESELYFTHFTIKLSLSWACICHLSLSRLASYGCLIEYRSGRLVRLSLPDRGIW